MYIAFLLTLTLTPAFYLAAMDVHLATVPRRWNHFRHSSQCFHVAGHSHGPARVTVRGGGILPECDVPYGLPLQAAEGAVHNENISLQREQQRRHLPRHSQGPVESRIDDFEGAAVDFVVAH